MAMNGMVVKASRGFIVIFFVLVSLCLFLCVHCEDTDAKKVYNQLTDLTKVFTTDVKDRLGFCVEDADSDWDAAFNFQGNLKFLTNCMEDTEGDVTPRLCTAAEIRFYFDSVLETGLTTNIYMKPNKNCNLTSWVSGCEPGWGCSLDSKDNMDLKNRKDIPYRTQDCKPCCEGFFCPQGITCMIPCPLGSYCPLAKLNKQTGICDPYNYQIPPGNDNHTCGGADIWSDVKNSSFFCNPGSYCPDTITKNGCSRGHYCRMGSTDQLACFHLAQCNANTENQKIHAYGVIFIGVLSTILVIIYNCSDQVLHTREKRQAKSREAAARHVRETAQARERWKLAKDAAKKRGFGLQQQLSRTFSRRKSTKQPEPLTGSGPVKAGPDEAILGATIPESSSEASKGKKKERSNLTKMLHAMENDPQGNTGLNLQIGDKNIKKQVPKGKQLHTQSQIFKYAYGQIEKEKAMQEKNKGLTFSGVISMATDSEVRTRPPTEISFKDLTLTLKGKNKNLLRNLTGKLMPGRVYAVMGPSGAGKTTFLSTLAGKVTGCSIKGSILINGKNESIHSYKRIMGFVPQDDIVHGNLTVEENLRFSARCRLPADMPKPDKVLVVERVIESLGLQAVRDSLVGTVEKRGISGGQRKRVNVGLEMVIEPSLLFLDEPTTGLDSTSSNLLLKALRREALEGVCVCMVLHQPSYTLFRMFDDLILLGKGGLTVYHGPVKKVEEYFSGVGINVPERVNPPDHLIDVLEGMVNPDGDVSVQQLPVRWMLHNDYSVPPDMLHHASSSASATEESNEHSFAEDLWADVKLNAETKKDHLQYNFLHPKDLSNRTTPGIALQYRYFLGRVTKQRLRDSKTQAVDYIILLLAGACLGTLAKVDDATFGSRGYSYTVIAVSLLCKIAALRSFSLDKLEYWREKASGISSLAHFLSKDTVDSFNTIVKPLVYLSMFYFFNNPRSSFGDNYLVLICLVYCVTGMAYILAIYLDPGPAQLWSVLVPVVLTLVANQEKDSFFVKYFGPFCYTKWAMEAFTISNARRYSGVWLITRCGYLMQMGYDLKEWYPCLIILILYGVASRMIAYVFLVKSRKK